MMRRYSLGAVIISTLFTVLFICGGCGQETDEGQAGNLPQGTAGGPGPRGPGGRDSVVTTPGIKQIMGKLTKGSNSLTEVIGRGLKEAQPAWDTIQGQTKDYVKVAGDMGKYTPPKGTKESWSELTAGFVETATELDRAAQAKDKAAALSAHDEIKNSCMGCHRQHRTMGPGRGGPGGFGPPRGYPGAEKGGLGGPPPGGPPPDGP